MATTTEAMVIANNSTWKSRIKFAMQKGAVAVMAEAGTVNGHAKRAAYAEVVLSGDASIYEYSVGVVTNATILSSLNISTNPDGSNITDGDVEFTVNSMWDAFSGVTAAEV